MIELSGGHGLDSLPANISDVLNIPISPDGEVYVGQILDRTRPISFAQLTLSSIIESGDPEIHISASIDDVPLPLQLLHGPMHTPGHDGHSAFLEPIDTLDLAYDPDTGWLLNLPDQDFLECQATVDDFVALVSTGVRKHLAKSNPLQD